MEASVWRSMSNPGRWWASRGQAQSHPSCRATLLNSPVACDGRPLRLDTWVLDIALLGEHDVTLTLSPSSPSSAASQRGSVILSTMTGPSGMTWRC